MTDGPFSGGGKTKGFLRFALYLLIHPCHVNAHGAHFEQ